MTPYEFAQARSYSYALLGELYLSGLTEGTLERVLAVPELAGVLSRPVDLEQMAVGYQQLFGFNVFPYEAVFVGESAMLGGGVTEQVGREYERLGYPAGSSTSPDHIGHELGLLAFLCGAEADAWRDGLPDMAQRMQRNQQNFLAGHFLCWVPPFLLAVRAEKNAFYRAVGELTWQLVISHGVDRVEGGVPAGEFQLSDNTTLKDIAHYLVTPSRCGLFLSRSTISELAQQVNLPRGFGKRWQMLLTLLESAGRYEVWERLLDEVISLCVVWQVGYEGLVSRPGLETLINPWTTRLSQTQQLLQTLKTQAKQA